MKCFLSMVLKRNLKTQQSLVIFDLCLRKTGTRKLRDYRDVILVEMLRFRNVFRPHENEKLTITFSNSSGLKSVFKFSISVTDECGRKAFTGK